MIKLQKTLLSFTVLAIFTTQSFGASFQKYFVKLLKFEGEGYGIHKPVWGYKNFTKQEAYQIHKTQFWDKYHGDLFESQAVAEVFIDHLINAGAGRESVNIKAFEAVLGIKQDGILTKADITKANEFVFPEQIVNPYINYRIYYYKTRRDAAKYGGWITRAKSFFQTNEIGQAIADYLILPHIFSKKTEEEITSAE